MNYENLKVCVIAVPTVNVFFFPFSSWLQPLSYHHGWKSTVLISSPSLNLRKLRSLLVSVKDIKKKKNHR